MNIQADELQLLRLRLARLQKAIALGFLCWILHLLVLVPGSLCSEARAEQDQDVLCVRRLELMDSNGKLRAVLEATTRGAQIRLKDTTGLTRVLIAEDEDHVCLRMTDFDTNCINLSLHKGQPNLGFSDDEGKTTWSAPGR